jgi:hypothetical protein
MTTLTREIRFEPGYDHRYDHDPDSRLTGAHGLTIRFLLTGPQGAVQFVIYTGSIPAALGYHWRSRVNAADQPPTHLCDVLGEGWCVYNGSDLNREPLLAGLITDGHEYVWTALEAYHDMCDAAATDLSFLEAAEAWQR